MTAQGPFNALDPLPAAEASADEVTGFPASEEVPIPSGQDDPAAGSADWWTDDVTPTSWQLTVDARDPHAQADFWAEVLHYEVEDNGQLVTRLLDSGQVDQKDTLTHNGVAAFADLEAIRGDGRRLLFQRVPEEKSVKNRLHLDLNLGPERMHAEVERLSALGARQIAEVSIPGSHHFVLQDPEGNEFCVQ